MSDLPHALPKVQAAFDLPFKEQVAFFAQKVRLPTQSYKDLTAVQHDKAFVVAGAMKADLLQDLYDAVQKAINDGESIGQFRKRFDDIVAKRGWANWTGSDSREGKAWRTQIIYSTNLRTSHAAGRWQQMTDPMVMKMRPYWQYRHVTIENPRINHKRLNNLVLPADDSWWRVNYPPNGWGCHCYVITLSRSDMDRQNLSVGKTPSFDGADDGWGHAVGSTWRPDYSKYSKAIAAALIDSLVKQGIEPQIEHQGDV